MAQLFEIYGMNKIKISHHLRRTITFTLNVRVTVFPAGSVNVYVTGVVPGGNELPDCLSEVGKTVPELSVTVGSAQVTGTMVVPNGTVKVKSSGKIETCGGIPSAMDK